MLRDTGLCLFFTICGALQKFAICAAVCVVFYAYAKNVDKTVEKEHKQSISDMIDTLEENSIWNSKPMEIDSANVQILDKISGKAFAMKVQLNQPSEFANIKIKLKRCFKNSPDDKKEVYAFIEISENDTPLFGKWLFASSPSVNLFAHPVYDIRIKF